MVSVTAPAPLAALGGPNPAPNGGSGEGSAAFARQLERAAQDRNDAPQTADAPGNRADANDKSGTRDKTRAPDANKPPRRSGERTAAHDDKVAKPDAGDKKSAAKDADGAPGDLSSLLAGLMGQHTQAQDAADSHAAAATSARVARAAQADAATATTGSAAEARGGGKSAVAAQRDGAGDAQKLPALHAEAATFVLPQGGATALHETQTERPSAGAAPAYEAQIDAAVGTPEFAPGLSAEVNIMLRDGVQQARLHLNPAEMGPITVQIQLDAGQAQVNMTAEQAATRQALEQAMPELAGALRENGLTLTGGGVFEQAQQPRDDGSTARSGGSGGGTDVDSDSRVDAAPPRRVASAGSVDLYA
jgi:flagellar hook-length control protein FliK